MINKNLFHNLLNFVLPAFLVCLSLSVFSGNAQAAIGADYNIICGETPSGERVSCNMSTQQCILCVYETTSGCFFGACAYRKERLAYHCINRSSAVPRNCQPAPAGGISGDQDTKLFDWPIAKSHVEGINCVTENLMAMYGSTCYSCEIVETLASAFIRAAAKAYEVSREAGNAILVVGMILWIGFFVLKNISSFTTVEPMKMIQDLLMQLFKVLLAFVIVNSGIPTILHYTMEPIMLAGTDFADAIVSANAGINIQATQENLEKLRQEREERERQERLETLKKLGFDVEKYGDAL